MGYDINEHVRNAQTALQLAIATLDAARADYQHNGGAGYAEASATQTDLTTKIKAAEDEAATAEADFQRKFAAAGYVRTDAVGQALARKAEALAMADAMRVALAQGEQKMRQQLMVASEQGRAYVDAHASAFAAYARAEAFEAVQEAGERIARAMALCAHVPKAGSAYEDPLGRMHWSERDDTQIKASRWAFILEALATLAKERPEYAVQPVAEVLGRVELGALSAREFLSPAQAMLQRKADAAGVPEAIDSRQAA